MALFRDVRLSIEQRPCMQITVLSTKIRLKLQINIFHFLMNLILKNFYYRLR
jgi:hypothetical protein